MGDTGRQDPPLPLGHEVGPSEAAPAPEWVFVLALLAGLAVVVGFGVAAARQTTATGNSFDGYVEEQCGTALSPVWGTRYDDECLEALLGPRVAVGALAGFAAIGGFLGIRYSGSVGRTHNHERDACLVVASVAVFLLTWVVLALLVAQMMPLNYSGGD